MASRSIPRYFKAPASETSPILSVQKQYKEMQTRLGDTGCEIVGMNSHIIHNEFIMNS